MYLDYYTTCSLHLVSYVTVFPADGNVSVGQYAEVVVAFSLCLWHPWYNYYFCCVHWSGFVGVALSPFVASVAWYRLVCCLYTDLAYLFSYFLHSLPLLLLFSECVLRKGVHAVSLVCMFVSFLLLLLL